MRQVSCAHNNVKALSPKMGAKHPVPIRWCENCGYLAMADEYGSLVWVAPKPTPLQKWVLVQEFRRWRDEVDQDHTLDTFDLALGWLSGVGMDHDTACEAARVLVDEDG